MQKFQPEHENLKLTHVISIESTGNYIQHYSMIAYNRQVKKIP